MALNSMQAAQAGRCSTTTIAMLVRRGQLKAAPRTGRQRLTVLQTRDEVRAIVKQHTPKAGWHKRGDHHRMPDLAGRREDPFTGAQVPATAPLPFSGVNGHESAGTVTVTGVSPALAALLELSKLPADKRALLLTLGTRCNVETLALLTELTAP